VGRVCHNRRSAQTSSAGGNEKEAVKGYFNSVGFERWNKIYGTTDDISSVRPDGACCA
jgi:magnesium-protoporphyrin O-methyltransferase